MQFIDISAVSNKTIPDYIYALAPNLQAQPALVRFWCKSCLVGLTTTSKTAPNGSLDSFIETLLQGDFCARKGNFGVCNLCSRDHKGECVGVCDKALR